MKFVDSEGFCTDCPSAALPALVLTAFLFVICVLAGLLYILLVRPPKSLAKVSTIGRMVVRGFVSLGPSKLKVRPKAHPILAS